MTTKPKSELKTKAQRLASALAKLRWDAKTPEERLAHSEMMTAALLKSAARKRKAKRDAIHMEKMNNPAIEKKPLA